MPQLLDRAIGSSGSMKINILRCQYTPGEQLRRARGITAVLLKPDFDVVEADPQGLNDAIRFF
jgi:hypothetical protein